MLEDSILSSPCCSSNKSIHKDRSKRKCKRRIINNKGAKNKHEERHKEKYLQQLYDDSDEDSGEVLNRTFVVSSRVRDYVPFEMENILIEADRCASINRKVTNINIPAQDEGGFLTCQRLTEQDQSFLITDSELLHCCDEADEVLMANTPPKELRLVNSILQDFCLSPLTSTTVEPTIRFWEYSPQFVLKNKPERTYSVKSRRIDVNKRLEFCKPTISDEEDCVSSSSSLISIQESSQLEEDLLNTTLMPQASQKVGENLLNLTSFFTLECSPTNVGRTSSPNTLLRTDNVADLIEEICSLKAIYSNTHNRLESYSSNEEGFHGFSNSLVGDPSAKEISLSNEDCEAGGLDVTLLSPQQFHIPDEDREVLCPESNNGDSCQRIETKNEDYNNYWNDDCPEVFALIKTQEILHQHKNMSFQNRNCTLTTKDYISQKTPDNKNLNIMSMDIKTASSKSNKVSKEAQMKALHILKDPSDTNRKEKEEKCNKETFLHDEIKDSRQQHMIGCNLEQQHIFSGEVLNEFRGNKNIYDIPSTSKAAMAANITVHKCNGRTSPLLDKDIGFQTANGKEINISTKAMKNVEKLLKIFCSENLEGNENALLSMKKETKHKNSKDSRCDLKQGYSEDKNEYWDNDIDLSNVVFSEWPLENQLQDHTKSSGNFKNNPVMCRNIGDRFSPLKCQTNLEGFQTAGGKKLSISTKAEKIVTNLLQDFQTDFEINTSEMDLFEIKSKLQAKHNKMKALNKTDSIKKKVISPNSQANFQSFQTAGGKKLAISAKAEKTVANFLEEFQNDCDNFTYENDIFDIKKRLQTKNNKLKATQELSNSEKISSTDCQVMSDGFQTAGGKKIAISAKAEKAVASILQEVHACCDNMASEQNLHDIKSKLQAKHTDHKATNIPANNLENNAVVRNDGSQSNSTFQKQYSPPAISLKRTIDTMSTPLPSSKRILLDVKHSFSELSMRSPLNTSATKSIISRKNLLSLSKNRKQKSRFSTSANSENPREEFEPNEVPANVAQEHNETPIKLKASSSSLQTPWTPNINEFFNNAPKSSTPRAGGVRFKPVQEIEGDFKPIAWDANNASTSIKSTKLSDDSHCNITLNSPNPTANDRIGRLKMYGEPPAISPISMDSRNNCRPSGLRRTRRSMRKKSESH